MADVNSVSPVSPDQLQAAKSAAPTDSTAPADGSSSPAEESSPPPPPPPPTPSDEADISTDAKLGLNDASDSSSSPEQETPPAEDASASDPANPLAKATPNTDSPTTEAALAASQALSVDPAIETKPVDPVAPAPVAPPVENPVTPQSEAEKVIASFSERGVTITDADAKWWVDQGGVGVLEADARTVQDRIDKGLPPYQSPTGAVMASPTPADPNVPPPAPAPTTELEKVKASFTERGAAITDADAQWWVDNGGVNAIESDPRTIADRAEKGIPLQQPIIVNTAEGVTAQFKAAGMDVTPQDAAFFAERGGKAAWDLDPTGAVVLKDQKDILTATNDKVIQDNTKASFAKEGLNITDQEAKFWQERGGINAWKADPTGATTVDPSFVPPAEVLKQFQENGVAATQQDAEFFSTRGGYDAWLVDGTGATKVDPQVIAMTKESFAQQGVEINTQGALKWAEKGGGQAFAVDQTGNTSILNATSYADLKSKRGQINGVEGSENIVAALNNDGGINNIYQISATNPAIAQGIPENILNKQAVTVKDGFGKTDPNVIADNFINNKANSTAEQYRRVEGSSNIVAKLDANGALIGIEKVTGEGIQATNIPMEKIDKSQIAIIGGFGQSNSANLANNFINNSEDAKNLQAVGGAYRRVEGSNNLVASLNSNGEIMGFRQVRADGSVAADIPPGTIDPSRVSVINGFGATAPPPPPPPVYSEVVSYVSREVPDDGAAAAQEAREAEEANIATWAFADAASLGADPGKMFGTTNLVEAGHKIVTERVVSYQLMNNELGNELLAKSDPVYIQEANEIIKQQVANENLINTYALADAGSLNITLPPLPDNFNIGAQIRTETVANKIQTGQKLESGDLLYQQGAQQMVQEQTAERLKLEALQKADANLGVQALADAAGLGIDLKITDPTLLGHQLQAEWQARDINNLGMQAMADATGLGVTIKNPENAGSTDLTTNVGVELTKEKLAAGTLTDTEAYHLLGAIDQANATGEAQQANIRVTAAKIQEQQLVENSKGMLNDALGVNEFDQTKMSELEAKFAYDPKAGQITDTEDRVTWEAGRLLDELKNNPSAENSKKILDEIQMLNENGDVANSGNPALNELSDFIKNGRIASEQQKMAATADGNVQRQEAERKYQELAARYQDAPVGALSRSVSNSFGSGVSDHEAENTVDTVNQHLNLFRYLDSIPEGERTEQQRIDRDTLANSLSGIDTLSGLQTGASSINDARTQVEKFIANSPGTFKSIAVMAGGVVGAIGGTIVGTAVGGIGAIPSGGASVGAGIAAGAGAGFAIGGGTTLALLGTDDVLGGEYTFKDYKDAGLDAGIQGGVGGAIGGGLGSLTQLGQVANSTGKLAQAGRLLEEHNIARAIITDTAMNIGSTTTTTLQNGGDLGDAVNIFFDPKNMAINTVATLGMEGGGALLRRGNSAVEELADIPEVLKPDEIIMPTRAAGSLETVERNIIDVNVVERTGLPTTNVVDMPASALEVASGTPLKAIGPAPVLSPEEQLADIFTAEKVDQIRASVIQENLNRALVEDPDAFINALLDPRGADPNDLERVLNGVANNPSLVDPRANVIGLPEVSPDTPGVHESVLIENRFDDSPLTTNVESSVSEIVIGRRLNIPATSDPNELTSLRQAYFSSNAIDPDAIAINTVDEVMLNGQVVSPTGQVNEIMAREGDFISLGGQQYKLESGTLKPLLEAPQDFELVAARKNNLVNEILDTPPSSDPAIQQLREQLKDAIQQRPEERLLEIKKQIGSVDISNGNFEPNFIPELNVIGFPTVLDHPELGELAITDPEFLFNHELGHLASFNGSEQLSGNPEFREAVEQGFARLQEAEGRLPDSYFIDDLELGHNGVEEIYADIRAILETGRGPIDDGTTLNKLLLSRTDDLKKYFGEAIDYVSKEIQPMFPDRSFINPYREDALARMGTGRVQMLATPATGGSNPFSATATPAQQIEGMLGDMTGLPAQFRLSTDQLMANRGIPRTPLGPIDAQMSLNAATPMTDIQGVINSGFNGSVPDFLNATIGQANQLGRGSEAIVYQIPGTDLVLRVPHGLSPQQRVAPTLPHRIPTGELTMLDKSAIDPAFQSLFPDAQIGDATVLNKVSGELLGNIGTDRPPAEASFMQARVLAKMPQAAYDDLVNKMVIAAKNGYFFDITPDSLMINAKRPTDFGIIDVEFPPDVRDVITPDQIPASMLGILPDRPGNFVDTSLENLMKKVFKKITIASQQAGLMNSDVMTELIDKFTKFQRVAI